MQDLLSIGTNRRESMIGTGIGLGLAGYRLNPPGGPLPVLDLRFATDKSLTAFAGPTPSFSRASSGTYFDASGVLQSAGVNAARFNHVYNGTNWVSRGLLVEEQRTNLHPYSENLSATYNAGNGSFSSNVATAPDGNLTADKYLENTATDQHAFNRNPGSLVGTYTFSLFLKEAGRYKVGFLCQTPVQYVCVNLQTISTFDASGATATIQDVGNGWRRVTVTYNSLTNYFANHIVLLPDTATQFAQRFYTGNGSSGVFVWGTQIEANSFATSYVPNLTTGSTTRSADVCQITGSDFTNIYNANEWSVALEYDQIGQTNNGSKSVVLFSVSNGAGSYAGYYEDYTGNEYWKNYTTDYSIIVGSTSIGQLNKFAGCVKTNDVAATRNGAAVLTDTSTTMKTGQNNIGIGMVDNAAFWNGHIARLRYYRTRLENGTLRVLST